MKIQALEQFVALVEAGSICEAARRLYIAQPSLTKSLRLLEEELGVVLVRRSKSGVRLTQQGAKVYVEAKQVVEYYKGWKELGKQNQLQQVDLYAYLSFPDFLFPDIVLKFRREHPELTINVTVTERPETFISRSGSKPVLAMVMCRRGEEEQALCEVQGSQPVVLMEGAYRCLVNVRHPLASKASVSLEELSQYYLILPTMKSEEGRVPMKEGFLHNLLSRSPDQKKVEVESAYNVIHLVEKDPESYALAFWPAAKRYEGVRSHRLVAVPIEEECAKGRFVLCYSRQAYDRHPVVQRLVKEICQAARQFLIDHGEAAQ